MKEGYCKRCKKNFRARPKAQIFCSLICSNRFNLNHKRYAKLPKRYSVELAELFGILLGDGSVTKYFTKIHLNLKVEKEYARFVNNLVSTLFQEVSISVTERPERGMIEVQISSKDVSDYLNEIGFDPRERSIPDWIKNSNQFALATVRGLFDTEGTIGFKFYKGKNGNYFYKQLTVTNINPNILSFVESVLLANGFQPTRKSKKNIYISNKEDIDKYIKEIGSSNSKLTKKLKIQKIKQFAYGSGFKRMSRQQRRK